MWHIQLLSTSSDEGTSELFGGLCNFDLVLSPDFVFTLPGLPS